jgi:acyl-CoA synthetase (AMP-forming)/AMP-acid ligase II/alkylation response protein AidB-like acyl-CoA dehydrogenase/acyl carrier protein
MACAATDWRRRSVAESGDDKLADFLLPRRLALHARQSPRRIAYTFLREDGRVDDLSYGELERRVRTTAGMLALRAQPGDRALLLYPPGLDFIVAFYACLCAGLVAVPATMADRRRASTRLRALLDDADPALVLTATDSHGAVAAALAQAGRAGLPCVRTDLPASAVTLALPPVEGAMTAFLQYTSGSTAQPRGVEVTHENIAANVEAIRRAFGFGPASVMVNWLPLFHDMGLVGSVIAPLAIGFRCVLMSPALFQRQPARWLRAISDYRGTCAGAPDFGWDYCIGRVGEEQKAGLDLSSLEVAYSGSEPVRAATLRRFAAAFASCGFRPEAFFACYGMAEATLLVAGGPRSRAPYVRTLSKCRLEGNQVREAVPGMPDAREVVSCGPPAHGITAMVVDPDTCLPASPHRIGELWVAGPGVARGYRNRAGETEARFGARLACADAGPLAAGPWLRTGDLGFLRDGEVYITGRLKDLVIVNGRNIYPQDVEEVVEQAIEFIAPNMCAAFAFEEGGRERLAIVAEADRTLARALQRGPGGPGGDRAETLARQVRSAVTQQFGVAVASVVFVRPGAFPRTTSGKVQRARCKQLARSGQLEAVFASGLALAEKVAPAPVQSGSSAAADAMIAWFRQYAARRLDSRLIDERRTVPPHVVLDLGNQGFFGLQAPREYGGRALSNLDLMRVLEQLAAVDLTVATMVGVHNGLGLRPLLQFGPEALQRQLLPLLASGRQMAAYALTEPAAGSNPMAMQARAERANGGWRLCAEKQLIGLGSWSGLTTVVAKAFDQSGAALGPIALLVPEDAPGLAQGPEALTMGMRGIVQNTVRFNDVFVPDAQVLLAPGEGMEVARDAMGFSRLGIGALCVGAIKRCAQLMVRYGARRDIATGRLLDNPVACARLHELTCAAWALEALVEAIAGALDARVPLPQHACLACKCVGSELLWEAADRLVQMLGGRGYVETNGAPQLLRDARALRILEGPSETLYMHLGAAASPQNGAERYIAEGLERAALAAELGALVTSIKSRAAGARLFIGEGADAQWLDYRVGELCAFTVLLGATERRAARSGQGDAEMAGAALAWARARVDGLRRAIAAEQDAARLYPSPQVLRGRIDAYVESIGDVEQAAAGEERQIDPLLQRAEPAAPGAGRTAGAGDLSATRQLVHDSVAKWLGSDRWAGAPPIGYDTPFTDLGIDSLATVPIASELEQRTALPILPELLFDYQTVNALADYIDTRRQEKAQ